MPYPLESCIAALPPDTPTPDAVMQQMHDAEEREKALQGASGMLDIFATFSGGEPAVMAMAYLETREGKADLARLGYEVEIRRSSGRPETEGR